MGSSVAHGLLFIGNVLSTDKMVAKLANPSSVNTFLAKAAGLNGHDQDGLAGYIDAHGNYHEDGLAGYIDENGDYIEDSLAGYIDKNGDYIEDGLAGYIQGDEALQAGIDMNGNIVI
jgi:hypothetical protein